ncbi:MAG: methyltransferase domain-containing protein [Chloroflexota bacterium]
MSQPVANPYDSQAIKACCTAVYGSEWTRMLLGDSFHPGGLSLTERLGCLLELSPNQRVLDVAAGRGTSARFLARRFSCQVVGLEYGRDAVALAREATGHAGLNGQVCFVQGDAETPLFAGGVFDAVLCECSFCLFPNKMAVATEWVHILKPGGWLGLSDLVLSGPLPASLDSLLGWVTCLAGAQPVEGYVAFLEAAGLTITRVELHDVALEELVRQVQGRLLTLELWLKLRQVNVPELDFNRAREIAHDVSNAVRTRHLGYTLIIARKQ